MAEMKRFAGYEAKEASGNAAREKLPVGAYVCKLLGAKLEETSAGQKIVFQVEISEGQYAGFYKRDYDAQSGSQYGQKYRGNYSFFYPTGDGSERDGWNVDRFNKAMGAIEASNPDYKWDWKLASLKNKTVGILTREASYNGASYTEIGCFTSADRVRSGNWTPMQPRAEKNKPAPVQPAQTAANAGTESDDEELPF